MAGRVATLGAEVDVLLCSLGGRKRVGSKVEGGITSGEGMGSAAGGRDLGKRK